MVKFKCVMIAGEKCDRCGKKLERSKPGVWFQVNDPPFGINNIVLHAECAAAAIKDAKVEMDETVEREMQNALRGGS